MGRKRRRGRDDDLFQVAKVRDGVRRLAEEPEGVRRMAERFGWLEVWRVGKSGRRRAEEPEGGRRKRRSRKALLANFINTYKHYNPTRVAVTGDAAKYR